MGMRVSDIIAAKLQEPLSARTAVNKPDFEFTLAKVDERDLQDRLSDMIGKITEQGKLIAQHMEISQVKAYRAMICDFVNEIVNRSHKFYRQNFLDRRGRHRVYGIVKLVDKNLDELAQELLKAEKDHIAILEKTDSIRGLLMDLIV